jgi:hypothetical protein
MDNLAIPLPAGNFENRAKTMNFQGLGVLGPPGGGLPVQLSAV